MHGPLASKPSPQSSTMRASYSTAHLVGRLQLFSCLSVGSLVSLFLLDAVVWFDLLFFSMTLDTLHADFIWTTAILRPDSGRRTPFSLRRLSLSLVALVPAGAQKPERILIVEDIPINQIVSRRMVERLGYEAEILSNGLLALQRLEYEAFDLILMDCQMPIMDGYTASREIRQAEQVLWRGVPILGFSANAERDRCIAAGMDDLIQKPVELSDLAVQIERHMRARSRIA